jgi:hypothetical protein
VVQNFLIPLAEAHRSTAPIQENFFPTRSSHSLHLSAVLSALFGAAPNTHPSTTIKAISLF